MMGTGIQICGLNGCGKSTLGRALAGALGYHFIDNEDLYFVRSAPDAPYANARTREEAAQLAETKSSISVPAVSTVGVEVLLESSVSQPV